MKDNQSNGVLSTAQPNPQEEPAKRKNDNEGDRFTLTITDPQNKLAEGPVTISIEVVNNSVAGLSATDEKDNVYRVGFHLKKVIPKGTPVERVTENASPGQPGDNMVGDTTGAAKIKDGVKPNDDDQGEDEDGECQVCTMKNRVLTCETVPCPT